VDAVEWQLGCSIGGIDVDTARNLNMGMSSCMQGTPILWACSCNKLSHSTESRVGWYVSSLESGHSRHVKLFEEMRAEGL
jgi:hypothetical protein